MTQDPDDDDAGRWPTKLRIGLLVLGVLLGAVAAPMIYAQVTTNDYQIGENATYVAPDGLEIEAGEDIETNRQHPFPDSSTVDFGPEAEFSADGDAHARVSGLESQWLVLDELDASSNELRVRPDDQSQVHVQGAATRLEVNSIALDDGNADLRVTTSGSTTLDVWDLPSSTVVLAVDADTSNLIETIETDSAGSGTFSIDQSRDVRFVSQTTSPTIGNVQPADGATVGEYDVNLSADIGDADFAETWGDDATVVFNDLDDGTEILNTTIGSNQTVSTTWSALDLGENRWNVTVSDEYGNTESSGPLSVSTPSEIVLRNEETHDLIDGTEANATVTFFPEDEERIVRRTTTTGRLNLTGLPSDSDIIISASAEGYHTRQVIIRTITEQQTVYLLDTNATSAAVTFELNDQTGEFPSRSTDLVIEKPLTINSTTEWRVLAADEFGTGGVAVDLLVDARYRLTVRNDAGDDRVLGSYTATVDELRELTVGSIEWTLGGGGGDFQWGARYFESGGDEYVRFRLEDGAGATTDLDLAVYQQGNRSNELYNATTEGPYGNFSVVSGPLSPSEQNRTWVVEWEGQRNGETTSGRTIVGTGSFGVGTSLDGRGLELVTVLLIVFVAGFFPASKAAIGSVVVSMVGLVLWSIGWLQLPLSWILAALAIAAIARAVKTGGLQS